MYFLEERIRHIANELKELSHRDKINVPSYQIIEGDFPFDDLPGSDAPGWQSLPYGALWGGRDKHYWLKTEICLPERYAGKTIAYEATTGNEGVWDATNPQFLIYVNGKLIQGLDVNHREIILTSAAIPGEAYEIALQAYSGMHEDMVAFKSFIAILDRDIEKLYYDLNVPLDAAVFLDKEDKRRIDMINCLNNAVNLLDLRKPWSESFCRSVKEAGAYLQNEFYNRLCHDSDIKALCIGHTHIDVAWLWTLSQTREKAARSFSTVLNLMSEFPEYTFMSSQPQLYKFIKEDHPDLYDRIREKIREGRWEPEGAMWLEADCNLSSGESLVRQILFGKRFFEKEFGIDSKILWLPDVFGYSAALPQILKKSGVDYFMTTKIGWNEYNKMPYDSFMWQGLDGTEVLTHFVTTRSPGEKGVNDFFTTYNGEIRPAQIFGAWQRYQQKDIHNEVLVCFGYGDGGGGPSREMLENARRLEKGIPGMPQVRMGKALEFFKKLDLAVSHNRKIPKWVGELYLEYHRGTYTSMARNKRYNRKAEFLCQDAELFSSISNLAAQGEYPRDRINSGWETILLNQFHDILPGSSIKEVYEESKAQYENVLKSGQDIISRSFENIIGKINLDAESVVVFNSLSFTRSDVAAVTLPKSSNRIEILDLSGDPVPSQFTEDGRILFHAKDVPAKGYKVFRIKRLEADTREDTGVIGIVPYILENSYFCIEIDDYCNIVSIYDKTNGREVLKPGARGNVLQAFEDKPFNYDAWDINIYYQEKMWEINQVEQAAIVEDGPVRTSLRIKRRFLDSTITQTMHIYHVMPRIDFDNRIDWKERHILLKAAFPVDVHAEKATYDIQYGNVERPTHWNTSWDAAKFEVCAHKWADLSEAGYGVSLLNDCKYGHDIKDGVMRLTLLKSATSPNVDADREIHNFSYSLYPHSGGWREAQTIQQAYGLNCPLYTQHATGNATIATSGDGSHLSQNFNAPENRPLSQSEFSFVSVDKDNVIIEAVKKAEDSNHLIIRLYECHNRRTQATVSLFKEIRQAWECDLLENNIDQVDISGRSFSFEIKPYEIRTFKLEI